MVAAPDPGMRPLSVSTALFDGYPMARAIEEIARSGVGAIEPAFIRGYVDFDESAFLPKPAETLRRLIEVSGLKTQAVSAHMDLSAPDAPEMLKRRVAFAATLGARYLMTNAGPRNGRQAVLRCLDAVLGDCEELGVVLALENPGHGADDLLPDRAAGADLVAAVASPFVRLNYDVGNVFTYSREAVRPEDDLVGEASAIAHAHLKDVASTADGWRFTAIGEGAIDYAAVWRRLPKDCPVGIELPLRLDRTGRRDPVRCSEPLALDSLRAALAASLAYVHALDAGPAPA